MATLVDWRQGEQAKIVIPKGASLKFICIREGGLDTIEINVKSKNQQMLYFTQQCFCYVDRLNYIYFRKTPTRGGYEVNEISCVPNFEITVGDNDFTIGGKDAFGGEDDDY